MFIGSKAATKLEKLLTPKLLQGDIKKLSTTSQTSALESFHSVMLMFVPKNTAYSNIGMKARYKQIALINTIFKNCEHTEHTVQYKSL